MDQLTLSLVPAAPFRLALTAWVLRRRPNTAVDRWDGQTYRRVLVVGDTPIAVAVVQTGRPSSPRLQVTATGMTLPPHTRISVARAAGRGALDGRVHPAAEASHRDGACVMMPGSPGQQPDPVPTALQGRLADTSAEGALSFRWGERSTAEIV